MTEPEQTHPHSSGSWHPDCPACPDEPGPWDVRRPAGELTPSDTAEEIS